VDPGTEAHACRHCSAPGAPRVISAPAEPLRLVRAPSGNRRQEERNRKLREATKREFRDKRRAREAAKTRNGGGQ
jgi:hypothetical protein